MGEQHSYGLLIASVVAIVAIVGLVILFSKTSATGALSHIQWGGRVSFTPRESESGTNPLERKKHEVQEQIKKTVEGGSNRLLEIQRYWKTGAITTERYRELTKEFTDSTVKEIQRLKGELLNINNQINMDSTTKKEPNAPKNMDKAPGSGSGPAR